jgi:hypothetical protein
VIPNLIDVAARLALRRRSGFRDRIDIFCDNLRVYLEGGSLRNVIDWERGY